MGREGTRARVRRLVGGVLLTLLWCGCPSVASPQSPLPVWQVTPERISQGGVATLTLASAAPVRSATLRLGGRALLLVRGADGRLVTWLGVDLEQPTGIWEFPVEAVLSSGESFSRAIRLLVDAGQYPVQRLTVPRVFTEPDPATLERIAREKAALDRLWEDWTPERLWRGAFQPPVGGPGAGFGVRRIINGEPRAPHTGQDYGAAAGTAVLAANAGRVAVEADQFFSGKSLILDHGQGLYTMYFHLSEFLAAPGQLVGKGQEIARVGSTGRVTGPHLHWGARLNGARINPEGLLHLTE
jgi:hypothetical protein